MKNTLLIICLFYSLTISAQNHWEAIVLAENTWAYLEGNSEPQSDWNTSNFDASAWSEGSGGIGFSDGDDETTIANVSSLYMRKSFEISDLSTIEQLMLYIDYDDGFVAYINGTEVARSSNVTDASPKYNSGTTSYREAVMYSGGLPEDYSIDKNIITQGSNVLAIHILNYTATSSDLSAIPFLLAEISSSTTQYQTTPSWFETSDIFYSSNLPIIKITTSGQSIVDDPKITAHMGIINNGYGNTNLLTDTFTDYDGSIGIELRGQSSQYFFPKKSYGFETRDEDGENQNVRLLDMPKENDWVLYAPYSDKSLMRNAITFELAKALDGYSSRTAFCEVVVDGQYQGIYILMEKVKRDDSRVDVSKLEYDDSDIDSNTGGYIFKVDKIDDDYSNNYSGWTTYPTPSYPNAMDITFQYVYPKVEDLEDEQRTYLKNQVTLAEEVLISSNYADKNIGYNKYLNLGSFVDFMLINEVSKEVDKYRYSTYFHKLKDSKGGEIFAGPIWDFNLGYGNVDYWDDGNMTSGWLYSDVNNVSYGIMFWWKRLMEDAHFSSIAKERYAQLRADEWSDENVNYLIDSISTLVYGAQERNYSHWPILGTYVWPNKIWENMTYNDEVASFQTWILARLAWMDTNISASDITPGISVTLLDEQVSTGEQEIEVTLQDQYFNHTVLTTDYFDIKGDDGQLEVDSVIYKNAETATILISPKNTTYTSTTYTIEVDDNILTGYTDLRSNSLQLASSLRESQELAFEIYPNPAHDYISIISTKTAQKVDVISLSGKTVLSTQGHETESLDISNINNGCYILNVTFENGEQKTAKFIKR